MTQQDDITQRVLTAEQEAVRRALEAYAESYDMMARVAKREGRDASVGVHAVAYDIRRNMVNAVLRALSKLRAPVADERAVEMFAERFALALKPVAYTTKRGAVYRGKSTQVGSENLCTISQAVYEFRAALASLPAPDERQAVAYLDLGTGGYMDMGTDLTDEQLAALPKGRHMLAIIGTHGVNGYTPASAPVAGERAALRQAVTLLLQVHPLLGPCDHELRDRIGAFLGKGGDA
jgi:hypothetical protein